MRNRRQVQLPAESPVEVPVSTDPVETLEAPEEPTVAASEAPEDEPYVSPAILAARSGEQIDFGASIDAEPALAEGNTDTQE